VKVKAPEKRAASFYLSPEWRSFMDALIVQRFGSRQHARCEDQACLHPTRRGIRIFGDHIHELKDGGAALNARNILCRCGSCHSRKTAEHRRLRQQGRGG
jgi:5-methylcytosine-specific restriction protein A